MSKARGLADLGNAYSDGALSNRNLIINGGFDVWQRSTDKTGAYFTYKTADRWRHYNGAMSMRSYRVDTSSDTDVPTRYALGLEVTAAGWGLKQVVEYLKAGTYTLSFYIKASVAGSLKLYNSSDSVAITTSWQRVQKTITVSSGQTDVFIVDNTSQTLVGTVYITGVQLEVGDTATPFEHRSYGQELALCQRYCQRFGNGESNVLLGMAHTYVSGVSYGVLKYHSTMRTTPSATFSTNAAGAWRFRYGSGAQADNVGGSTGIGADQFGQDQCRFYISTGTAADSNGWVRGQSSASYLILDAEL
jgi:hypothetical protein